MNEYLNRPCSWYWLFLILRNMETLTFKQKKIWRFGDLETWKPMTGFRLFKTKLNLKRSDIFLFKPIMPDSKLSDNRISYHEYNWSYGVSNVDEFATIMNMTKSIFLTRFPSKTHTCWCVFHISSTLKTIKIHWSSWLLTTRRYHLDMDGENRRRHNMINPVKWCRSQVGALFNMADLSWT